jgi:hypothetical protein
MISARAFGCKPNARAFSFSGLLRMPKAITFTWGESPGVLWMLVHAFTPSWA